MQRTYFRKFYGCCIESICRAAALLHIVALYSQNYAQKSAYLFYVEHALKFKSCYGIHFIACVHRRCAWIFERNFSADKEKSRRNTDVLQGFLTKFSEKICRKDICSGYEYRLLICKAKNVTSSQKRKQK